jgi:hypothetical protein
MVVPLLTTTSRRSPPFTWCCISGKACRSFSRPSLAGRPVLGQTAASPTSFPLEEPSHDKSPPRTTSLCLRLAHGPGRTTQATLPMREEERISMSHGNNSWRPCRRPAPGKSLNAGLTSRATITSPSSPALPHARLNPRHSSTLYDVHEPRLRLGRGKLGKHSDKLRQDQFTRGEGQASKREQSHPATRRLPRQGIATRLQCTLTDSDIRRDVPAAKHGNSFVFPLVPLPLKL